MRKNQQGFSVIELVITLAVCLVIVGLGWLVYSRNSKPRTIDAVLAKITKDAKNTYTNADFQAKDAWSAEASSTSYNKVAGYDYYVSSVGKGIDLAFNIADSKPKTVKRFIFFKKTIPVANNLSQVQSWAGQQLQKYGFTTTDNRTYTRNDTTCRILNDPASLFPNQTIDTNEPTNLLEINCINKNDLPNDAAQMKPFVDAYLKANPSLKASDLTVGPLVIKSKNGAGVISSSRSAGYDIAELLVTTKVKKQIALFYAKNADITSSQNSGWHYVTQANDEYGFRCGDMQKDPDARKALYDQVCLSAKGQVRLDTNNRALQ